MKKLIIILCCLFGARFNASAQDILSLQTASITGSTVITPVLPNLFKLLKASNSDFVATVKSLSYTQSKPDDPNTYQANSPEQIYNVDKGDNMIDIFFSDNGGYAKKVKDDFLADYPEALHKSLDNGLEAYYFNTTEAGITVHYCIFFDLPDGGGGGVTLLTVNQAGVVNN
jgi:hypothetical protein